MSDKMNGYDEMGRGGMGGGIGGAAIENTKLEIWNNVTSASK